VTRSRSCHARCARSSHSISGSLREASRVVYSVFGALLLAAYGSVVNQSRLDFNKLTGIYIVVFFVISQAVAFIMFRNVPIID
jgi:hypothetical protein